MAVTHAVRARSEAHDRIDLRGPHLVDDSPVGDWAGMRLALPARTQRVFTP